MVAVLFLIGQGLEKTDIISELFDLSRYPRRPNYEIAPEGPLLLYDIGYARGAPCVGHNGRPRKNAKRKGEGEGEGDGKGEGKGEGESEGEGEGEGQGEGDNDGDGGSNGGKGEGQVCLT